MDEIDTIAEARELVRPDATNASCADVCYAADAKGNSYRLPPPGLTARQRLEWANARAGARGKAKSPVSIEETGLNPEELARLSPSKRLALANEAMVRRR